MIVDLCCYGSVCLFTTDDKALRTGLQREGRKDGVQGANIGQEFSDDFGGNISFVWFIRIRDHSSHKIHETLLGRKTGGRRVLQHGRVGKSKYIMDFR